MPVNYLGVYPSGDGNVVFAIDAVKRGIVENLPTLVVNT
jgi:hypothetical protein